MKLFTCYSHVVGNLILLSIPLKLHYRQLHNYDVQVKRRKGANRLKNTVLSTNKNANN